MAELVSDRVAVPEEERLRHARGEGDPKHLPGLRGYQPPFRDYILSHLRLNVNTFFEKFFGGLAGRPRVTEGHPKLTVMVMVAQLMVIGASPKRS